TIFCVLSLFGHLMKGIDYEESIVAAMTLLFLIYNRKEYRIQANFYWVRIGILSCLVSFFAILVFETISFYIIDKRHFGLDFTWKESFLYALRGFLLFS